MALPGDDQTCRFLSFAMTSESDFVVKPVLSPSSLRCLTSISACVASVSTAAGRHSRVKTWNSSTSVSAVFGFCKSFLLSQVLHISVPESSVTSMFPRLKLGISSHFNCKGSWCSYHACRTETNTQSQPPSTALQGQESSRYNSPFPSAGLFVLPRPARKPQNYFSGQRAALWTDRGFCRDTLFADEVLDGLICHGPDGFADVGRSCRCV